MDLELTNRTVLVTGSYRGTGLVIARSFKDEGAEVFVHGFTVDQAEAAVAEIGGTPVFGDIRTDDGVAAVAEQVGTTPDILVNNYGTASAARWEGATAEDWTEMYEANVLSAQRLTGQFLPSMKRRSTRGSSTWAPRDRWHQVPATRTTTPPRRRWWP